METLHFINYTAFHKEHGSIYGNHLDKICSSELNEITEPEINTLSKEICRLYDCTSCNITDIALIHPKGISSYPEECIKPENVDYMPFSGIIDDTILRYAIVYYAMPLQGNKWIKDLITADYTAVTNIECLRILENKITTKRNLKECCIYTITPMSIVK